MADLALRWGTSGADLALEANDLARDDGLETAILISLYTDRRTDDVESVPSGDGDRRGWWGDAVPVVAGDRIGSRLWLLSREKEVPTALRRAEEYAREALAWLLEDRVAERVEVTASVPGPHVLGLTIAVHRPGADRADEFRFHSTWAAQEARRA